MLLTYYDIHIFAILLESLRPKRNILHCLEFTNLFCMMFNAEKKK